MDDARIKSLAGRVDSLESTVKEVERMVRGLVDALAPATGADTPAPVAETTPHPAPPIPLSAPIMAAGSIPVIPVAMPDAPEARGGIEDWRAQSDAPAEKHAALETEGALICPYCNGANPPDRERCNWCGWVVVSLVPPASIPESRAYRVPQASPRAEMPTPPEPPTSPSPQPQPAQASNQQPVAHTPQPPRDLRPSALSAQSLVKRADFWLNKIGIVLFLFGVAFLFKYSIDNGLLNEGVRVGMGVAFGTILLGLGLWLHKRRRHFSQVLMGGGISTYYITGYAAYVLFPNLSIPYGVALGFMVSTTFLAFALAVRHDEVTLSIIGLLGGMLTPFVLNNTPLHLPSVIAYTCFVLVGTSAVYMVRGWRSLLWNSLQSVASVLLVGYSDKLIKGTLTLDDRWALQAGAIFAGVAFWGVPVLREALSIRYPQRWRRPTLHFIKEKSTRRLIDAHVYVLAVLVPLSVYAFSWSVWGDLIQREWWGVIALNAALIMGMVYTVTRQIAPKLAYTHAMLGMAAVTTGLVAMFRGDVLLCALAVEGLALYAISRRFADKGTEVGGHLIFGAVGGWMAARLLDSVAGDPAFLNPVALTDLVVMAIAAGASFLVRGREIGLLFRSCVHIALLAWVWREGHTMPHGEGYVALAWAGYGLMIHLASRFVTEPLNRIGTQAAGHVALQGAITVLAARLIGGMTGSTAMLNEGAIVDLGIIALALAASFAARPITSLSPLSVGMVYRLFVHAATLLWLWREATPLDHEGGLVMLRWAMYLATVALVSYRLGDRVTLLALNVPFLAVANMLAYHVVSKPEGVHPFLNVKSSIDLIVLGLIFAVSFLVQPKEARHAYRIFAHGAVLGLIARELWMLPTTWETYSGYLMLSWAAYLAGVQLLSWWLRDRVTAVAAHVPFFVIALMLFARFTVLSYFTGSPEIAIFNGRTLFDALTIVLAGVISLVAWPKEMAGVYRFGVHAAVLGLLWRELHWLDYGGHYVVLAWAAYATLLHLVAWRLRHAETRWVGHALFALCGGILIGRFVVGLIVKNPDATAVFNPKGLADLGVIVLALVAYTVTTRTRYVPLAYGLGLHFAFLGWTWQELGLIPNNDGNGYVTIAWGVYAIVLVVAWLKLNLTRPFLLCGLGTLLAVAAKLFLVDLQYVNEVWRIILFLGFGAVFLLFSYYLGGVMKARDGEQKGMSA